MSSELEKTLEHQLFNELATLIEQSKQKLVVVANSSLTILFWQVGKRINEEILQNDRAEYGKQIIATVSQQLEAQFGRNFTEKNVRRMIRFAQEFSDFNILPPLVAQLTWSHFIELFPLKSMEAKLHQLIVEAKERIERNKIER